MPFKDPEKERASRRQRKLRYLEKEHIDTARFGEHRQAKEGRESQKGRP